MTSIHPVRNATAADAQTIMDVRNEAIRAQCAGFYDAELLAKWTEPRELSAKFVENVAANFQLIEVSGEVVACGMVNLENGKVDAIFVAPSAGRMGLGRQMMTHLEGMARGAGLTRLHLESTLNAVPFYRTLGFEGDTRAKYPSPRGFELDCILMEKRLA